MAILPRAVVFVAHILLWLGLQASFVEAAPAPQATASDAAASSFWVANIQRQGTAAFGGSGYQVFRNVKDFGAKGDGVTDDTDAINEAISSGNRCGQGCDSSTVTPALVYFPPGTYLVSKPIIQYYYTQMVGDALDIPVLKASSDFTGMAVIDADPYTDDGQNWYTNQNNFFRSVRNFVIDLTAMPMSSGAGIHWQVAQATSLQNIRFEMVRGGGEANKQQGVFMDNGSGGFMTDLVFNGGNYGMFVGNQQFTTRNMTFNDCNTAIFVNWNWAWTFKSLDINNCGVGLNMSNSPQNQTVGSVLILDSKLTNTPTGVITAFTANSNPNAAGTLVLDNVDFSGSNVAVAGIDGSTVLAGGSVVSSWMQGNAYTPSGLSLGLDVSLRPRAKRRRGTCAVRRPPPAQGAPSPASQSPVAAQTVGSDTVSSVVAPTSVASVPAYAVGSDSVPSAGVSTPESPVAAPTAGSNTVSSAGVPTPETTAATHTAGSGLLGISISIGLGSSPTETASSTRSGVTGPTCAPSPVSKTRIQNAVSAAKKPATLLNGQGKVFERSKPQYEGYPASSFLSVKSAGAKGDGVTDDTAAIQKVLDSATEDQIVYFDHGAYLITSTIKVPKNIKITGEIWPLLMATGEAFSDEKNPIPMLQIGEPGDTGSVEISDLILETKGPAPGAILMEWNVAEATQGSVGMWDVHFRVGGTAGTELQSDRCTKTPDQKTTPNPECVGAFMLLHITEKASAYIENSWFWVSDHELDLSDHNQINIYNGRGVLIESNGPVWMYGTASEHNQLYNYQIANAKNVFMGLIQTETPYYQSNPNALAPFTPQSSWSDPEFSNCTTDSCRKAWGLRVFGSSDVYVYGAGLYSFFDNYGQTCLNTESCQENMVQVDCSDVHIYGLSTKASTNMVTSAEGTGLVPQIDNRSNFCSTIALFQQTS